jgi:hypothetical protein
VLGLMCRILGRCDCAEILGIARQAYLEAAQIQHQAWAQRSLERARAEGKPDKPENPSLYFKK